MLFYSIFKTLEGKEVAVELKNGLEVSGNLNSVDQYMNVKLDNLKVVNVEKFPQMASLRNCFIRGSVIRYISLRKEDIDVELLQDAARREAKKA